MATLRELKTRIGSVSSSEKITGAMKMISSAKVHKFESFLRQLLPYKDQIQSIMGHLLEAGVNFSSPLTESRDVHSATVIVYGSDDGLCGAYNVNIFKAAIERIEYLREKYGSSLRLTVIPVGAKITKIFKKVKNPPFGVETVDGVNSKMEGATVDEFTHNLKDRFLTAETDLVEVFYMKFYSMSRQRFQADVLFPVAPENIQGDSKGKADKEQMYLFEPDPNTIFNQVLPMFALSTMQELTLENRASEQAARVMAMQSANDNAKKLLEQLQLDYNKLRQQSITNELLDIVGGQAANNS